MVRLINVNEDINLLASEKIAEKWDNVGILIGDENQIIKNILICLDVTSDVVEEAISKNVDLIIAHHPLIFSPIKKLNFKDFKSNIIKNLIKNDISVIAAHTNLDSAKLGLNDYMAKLLSLVDINVLIPNKINEEEGLGRVGKLKKSMNIEDFIVYVKEKFNLNYAKLISSNNREISTVAILGGSGGNFIYDIPKVDIYLTGDVKYHEAIDAIEMKQNVLDIGHFSEKVSKQLLLEYFKEKIEYKDINIMLSNVEKEPFEIR